jgi:hypothetical protein
MECLYFSRDAQFGRLYDNCIAVLDICQSGNAPFVAIWGCQLTPPAIAVKLRKNDSSECHPVPVTGSNDRPKGLF